MRELVVENQEVYIIPQNFRFANKGKVTAVTARDFILELEHEPDGILKNNFCEFYTQTPHGKLYFDSYAKDINGRALTIVSPAKHKFLQRRQYTRVKYVQNNFEIKSDSETLKVLTVDVSAGGLKFISKSKVDIDGCYNVELSIDGDKVVHCKFLPIRVEKKDGEYVVSGQFVYTSGHEKMLLTQFCEKRAVEIKNK